MAKATVSDADTIRSLFAKHDTDGDGKLSLEQLHLVMEEAQQSSGTSQSQPTPASPVAGPLTWDLHLVQSLKEAQARPGGVLATLADFVGSKLQGKRVEDPPLLLSDMVWSGVGIALAFAILGVMVSVSQQLPMVGAFHQQVGVSPHSI